MTPMKITFTFLFVIAFTEVASWTIDLPEARKYFFEKAEGREIEKENKNLKDYNEEILFFDNIVPDSPYNKDELEKVYGDKKNEDENDVYGGRYANQYDYMSYMEKKVHGIVHNGSVYLEGLKRALEEYGELLKNCSRLNSTQPQSPDGPWLPENERPQYGEIANTNGGNLSNQNGFPPNQLSNTTTSSNQNSSALSSGPSSNIGLQEFLNQTLSWETCERATRASEHVRRLAELSLWATKELQDRAYAEKYEKPSTDEEDEEMELLLRLAFFLDRLAFFTGFEPESKDYVTPKPTRPSTTTLPPFSVMGDVPDDVKIAMMECLKSSSSEPATERCRYPLQHPEFLRQMFNFTDSPENVQPVTEGYQPKDQSLREIMKDPRPNRPSGRSFQKRDVLTAVKRDKRSIDSLAALKRKIRSIDSLLAANSQDLDTLADKTTAVNRQKRTDDNPMLNIMKYYVKHRVWTNANPDTTVENSAEFDVPNHLTAVKPQQPTVKSIQKRAIDNKKSKYLQLPDDPLQDISNYVKHRKGVNYINDEAQSEKIKQYLDKIRHSNRLTAKIMVQKLQKSLKRQKRSIKYELKVLPDISQEPRQDLSYYVKNREGTDRQANLVQAGQVRAGLEQVFQTGNIEVVRRYGMNFNPLIPYPQAAGSVKSFFLDL